MREAMVKCLGAEDQLFTSDVLLVGPISSLNQMIMLAQQTAGEIKDFVGGSNAPVGSG